VDDLKRLFVEARAGREDALEALVIALWPAVYRLAFSKLQNRSSAEDCAQDACAELVVNLHRIRDAGSVLAWISTVTKRVSRRSRSREARFQSLESIEAHRIAEQVQPEKCSLLDGLPQELAIPPALSAEGYSSGEIGSMLGLSATAVRHRQFRARRILKHFLKGERNGD
jgi:RNA polymerase sigma factor (sigma-70 family)